MNNSIATMMAILATSLLPSATQASPARAETQLTVLACGATEFTPMSSLAGTLASRQCDGAYVNGIGSSLDEAVQNLNGFMAVRESGLSCTTDVHGVETGSYGIGVYATFVCDGRPITAVGGSVAISANNSLAIATEMAASGSHCSAPKQGAYYPELHGFRFSYDCGKPGASWRVAGLGSSIDDANKIVPRMLRYTAQNQRSCTFDKAELNGVVFKVALTCNNVTRYGYGSSITSAANDALLQAGV